MSKLNKFFFALLVLYSGIHFFASSGLFKPIEKIGGDFESAFPSFWAWKLNPKLILSHPEIIEWMGLEYIVLDKAYCEQYDFPLGAPKACNRLFFRKDGTEPKPILVKNQNWNYGPMLHIVTLPLMLIDNYKTALRTWHGITILFYFATVALWYLMLIYSRGLHSFPILALFIGIWFNYSGTYDALTGPEIEVFQFFGISLGLAFILRQKEAWGGAWMGAAAMAKFSPLGLLPILFLKGKYRAFFVSVLTVLVVVIITEFTLGWDWSYTRRLMLVFGDTTTSSNSHSLSSWIHRLFAEFDLLKSSGPYLLAPEVPNKPLAIFVTRIAVIGTSLFYALLFLKNAKKPLLDLEIAILFILMTTLVQWNHLYYMITVLVGYSIALSHLAHRAHQEKKWGMQVSLLCLSYVLFGYFFPGTLYAKVFEYFGLRFYESYCVLSIPVYGWMILLGWLTHRYIKGKGIPLKFPAQLPSFNSSFVKTGSLLATE